MHTFSYPWSLPVTWQRRRSHHTIRHFRKPHAARKLHVFKFYWTGLLLPIEVLHCGNRDFRPVLLLWPWPWPDNLHIRTRPVIYRMCENKLPTSRLSTVIVWQPARQTDRQTRPKLYTTPLRGWSKTAQLCLGGNWTCYLWIALLH